MGWGCLSPEQIQPPFPCPSWAVSFPQTQIPEPEAAQWEFELLEGNLSFGIHLDGPRGARREKELHYLSRSCRMS